MKVKIINGKERIKLRGRKGISEVVAYVLLVMIAISLSLLVYAWLKGYVIKPVKECPDGMSLIIEDYYCNSTSKILDITFLNKGLFNIDGFIIKASNKTGKSPILPLKEGGSNFIYFPGDKGLEPNVKLAKKFSYLQYNNVTEVEIIPFKKDDGDNLLCNKATIRQEIEGCV